MQSPLQAVFHGMDHSDHVETRITEEFEKLERLNGHITDSRVTVESPHKHHSKGAPYNISININVPGDSLAVSSGAINPAHDDINIAVRDAFNAMSRRLKEYTDRKATRRG